MHITVLSDNNGFERFPGEWGLSILIEYGGMRILLDAGASDLFLKNAATLGKDLSSIDFAVLSHAHYDHADGFVPLLREYPALKVYVRSCVMKDCYARKETGMEYIGVAPALLDEYESRLVRVDGDYRLAEGYEGAAVVAVKASCNRSDIHAAEHHCGEQNRVVDALGHDYDPAQVISERTEIYIRKASIAGEIAVFNEASYFGY